MKRRRPLYYCLDADGKTPIPWDGDVIEWAQRLEKTRHVAYEQVDEVAVSTIFLGIDCQWMPEELPLLFETMVLSGESGPSRIGRCGTYDEAMRMHGRALGMVLTERAQRKQIAQGLIRRLAKPH